MLGVNDGVRVGEWWGQRNTSCNPDSISTRNLISCWSLCSDELAQLKMYFTSNTHTMNDIRNTLRENSEQLVILGGCFSLLSFFSFTKHWKHATYLLYCLLVSRKERTEDCGTRRSPARQGALVSFLWLITKCYASSVAFSLFLFSSQLLSIAISEGSTRSQIKRWWRWSLGFSKLPPKRTHGPLEYIKKTVAVKIILITTTTTTDIAF